MLKSLISLVVARAALRRALTAGVLVCAGAAAAAGGAAPAHAHAELLWSDPPAGSSVPDEIDRITLTFSEAVTPGSVEVRLIGEGGELRRASSVGSADADLAAATAIFRPPVKTGDYVVTWRAVSSGDAHLVDGSYALRVGRGLVVAAPASVAPSVSRRATSTLPVGAGAARGVGDLAIAALLGGVVFVTTVWPKGAAVAGVQRLLWVSLGAAVASCAAGLVLLGAEISGGFGADAFTAAPATRAGAAQLARLAVLPTIAAPLLARLLRSGGRAAASGMWRVAAAAVAAVILTTTVLSGHAGDDPFRLVAGVLHLGGVAVWLGGLLVVALVVLPRGKFAELRHAVPRFSALAGSAFFAAVAGGFLLARSVVVDWRTLTSTPYGHALFLKAVLVLAIVVAAFASRTLVGRLDLRSRRKPRMKPLRVSVLAEVVLAAAVIAATAALANRPLPVPTSVRAPVAGGVSR